MKAVKFTNTSAIAPISSIVQSIQPSYYHLRKPFLNNVSQLITSSDALMHDNVTASGGDRINTYGI